MRVNPGRHLRGKSPCVERAGLLTFFPMACLCRAWGTADGSAVSPWVDGRMKKAYPGTVKGAFLGPTDCVKSHERATTGKSVPGMALPVSPALLSSALKSRSVLYSKGFDTADVQLDSP